MKTFSAEPLRPKGSFLELPEQVPNNIFVVIEFYDIIGSCSKYYPIELSQSSFQLPIQSRIWRDDGIDSWETNIFILNLSLNALNILSESPSLITLYMKKTVGNILPLGKNTLFDNQQVFIAPI